MAIEKAARGGREGEGGEGGGGGEERLGERDGGRKIDAAPDVDGELSKFQVEMEEVEDVEA